MKKVIFLLMVLLPVAKVIQAQKIRAKNVELDVLHFGHIGKTYKVNTDDHSTAYVRYLGSIKTGKGAIYKILTAVWIRGRSHQTTSMILIYTTDNWQVGSYHLKTIGDVPDHIENNQLVFFNKGGNCDVKLVTYLDFAQGLPKRFFRKCKGSEGDVILLQ